MIALLKDGLSQGSKFIIQLLNVHVVKVIIYLLSFLKIHREQLDINSKNDCKITSKNILNIMHMSGVCVCVGR